MLCFCYSEVAVAVAAMTRTKCLWEVCPRTLQKKAWQTTSLLWDRLDLNIICVTGCSFVLPFHALFCGEWGVNRSKKQLLCKHLRGDSNVNTCQFAENNIMSTGLALRQYTWPQYVHRGENRFSQSCSRKVCHDLPHPCMFVCDTRGSKLRY